MSKRVSPVQRLQAEIDGVFAGGEDLAGAIEEVARLGARLLLQTAIEAEVSEFLGRDRYQRAASADDARAGMRNGYCPTTVKTTAGPVTLARPGCDCWPTCAAHCTTHQPNCRKGIRKQTQKPAWSQVNLQAPPHRIMNANERNLRQVTFTPLPGRHPGRSRR